MDGFQLLQPVFEFCSKEDIAQNNGFVWLLEEGYHVPIDEFVALPHDGGLIILNRDYPNIGRIQQIFTEYCTIDNISRCHKRLNDLWQEFKELTSESNLQVLSHVGSLYWERRKNAKIQSEAQKTIKQFRKNRITTKIKGKEDIIHAIFRIGWDEKTVHGGCSKGSEYCFLYGYLSAMNDMKKGGV